MQINRLKAYDIIKGSSGKIITVSFTKKDGSRRVMTCRLGVTKGLTGAGRKFNPIDYMLMTVYDMQKKAYRMLNLKTMYKLKANKQEYYIKD